MNKFEERIFRIHNDPFHIETMREYFDDFLWEVVEWEYYPSPACREYVDYTCRRDISLPRIDEIIQLEEDYEAFTRLMDALDPYAGHDGILAMSVDAFTDCEEIQKQARAVAAEIRGRQG